MAKVTNDELLDLVNEQDDVIGSVWKSEAHQNPKLIHREIAIAVFNDRGEVLLQQRSLNKVNGPGMWIVSASGHVGKSEEPAKAAQRELEEEVGLKAKLVYSSKRFALREHKEARFFWSYYAVVKGRPQVALDPEEVMDYDWVKVDRLEAFAKDHDYDLQGVGHAFIMKIARELGLLKG
jgi:isopentenyl-diphosphate delta-isomerase